MEIAAKLEDDELAVGLDATDEEDRERSYNRGGG